MSQNRASVDLTGIRQRIEEARSDPLWKQLSMSKKLRILIEERLDQIDRGQGKYPSTLADILRPLDLEELSKNSRIPVKTLNNYIAGEPPTDNDLIILGAFVLKEDGSRWEVSELMVLRDHALSQPK